MRPFDVRLAKPDDAAAIAALAEALNREDGEPLGHITRETIGRDFFGNDPAGLAVIAEENGSLIGYATAHPGYAPTLALRGSYMGDLYVIPRARRQGVARALLRAVTAETARRGGSMVWWTSKPGNDGAVAFYRALGGIPEPLIAWSLDGSAFDGLAAEARP